MNWLRKKAFACAIIQRWLLLIAAASIAMRLINILASKSRVQHDLLTRLLALFFPNKYRSGQNVKDREAIRAWNESFIGEFFLRPPPILRTT